MLRNVNDTFLHAYSSLAAYLYKSSIRYFFFWLVERCGGTRFLDLLFLEVLRCASRESLAQYMRLLLNFFYVCWSALGSRHGFTSWVFWQDETKSLRVALRPLSSEPRKWPPSLSFFLRRGGWLNECDGPIELLDGGGGDFSENWSCGEENQR